MNAKTYKLLPILLRPGMTVLTPQFGTRTVGAVSMLRGPLEWDKVIIFWDGSLPDTVQPALQCVDVVA